MKPITLSPDLEKALMQGVISGYCAPEILNPGELSKKGKGVYEAVRHLIRKGGKPPFKPRAVSLTAAHLLGFEKNDVDVYLASLPSHDAGHDIGTILQGAREKQTLVSLVNRAGEQLASGDLRVSDLTGILQSHGHVAPIRSLASSVGKRWPKTPRGIEINSLPEITDITRGIFGVWAVAGEPGVGKSTLCWQVGLDVAARFHVVYYDLDGTGEEFLINRTREIYGSNIRRFKRRTKNLFIRTSIATLEEDLARFKPPALLVIDSLQTLPVGVRFAKESLDNWIRRFKQITAQGYGVLCVSEKARSEYGEANLSGFKGSGDIEYGVTVGLQLLAYGDDDSLMKCVLVKGRHSKRKGHIVDLERDRNKVFWFNEIEPFTEEDDEPKRTP